MADLPGRKIPIEGGWGSSSIGISLTGLSLVIMALMVICPQFGVESFILTLITASCLMMTGAILLTLVSDYALILSTVSIFLLLLFWRLRNIDSLWLFVLSILTFLLAIIVHKKSPERRRKGRARVPK